MSTVVRNVLTPEFRADVGALLGKPEITGVGFTTYWSALWLLAHIIPPIVISRA